MQAIWRNEWIHEYETPWSIFEKLSFANRISRGNIFKFAANSFEKNKNNPKKMNEKLIYSPLKALTRRS